MKYFAMIDGERRGPYELNQLAEAGVRPSTYVWCKGMPDWEKAEDVADICRMFRGRLYDLLHPTMVAPDQQQAQASAPAMTEAEQRPGSRFDHILQDTRLPSIEEIDARQDISRPPANMLFPAILVTLLFFPPLGIFAIYFAVASKRCWAKANESQSGTEMKTVPKDTPSADDWRRLAHEYCRAAKMWTGITFFIGLILYGFLFSKIL
ncbi:MAG: GYF domain-containing protein [Muribaculaceae bacterium]|nr:GYF domain-containing protein [Muribaculaceae bacterium]